MTFQCKTIKTTKICLMNICINKCYKSISNKIVHKSLPAKDV